MPAQTTGGSGIFAASLDQVATQQIRHQPTGVMLEDPEIENIPATIEAEDVRYERYASPPDWFSPPGGQTQDDFSGQTQHNVEMDTFQPLPMNESFQNWGELQTWAWPTIDMDVMYGLTGTRWDDGNL